MDEECRRPRHCRSASFPLLISGEVAGRHYRIATFRIPKRQSTRLYSPAILCSTREQDLSRFPDKKGFPRVSNLYAPCINLGGGDGSTSKSISHRNAKPLREALSIIHLRADRPVSRRSVSWRPFGRTDEKCERSADHSRASLPLRAFRAIDRTTVSAIRRHAR